MTDISSVNLVSRLSFNFKVLLSIFFILILGLLVASIVLIIYNYENIIRKRGSSKEKTMYWISALLLGIGLAIIIVFLTWSIISLIPGLEAGDEFITDINRISTASISSKDLRETFRKYLIAKTGNPNITNEQVREFANYLKGDHLSFKEAAKAGVNYPNLLRSRLSRASYKGDSKGNTYINPIFKPENYGQYDGQLIEREEYPGYTESLEEERQRNLENDQSLEEERQRNLEKERQRNLENNQRIRNLENNQRIRKESAAARERKLLINNARAEQTREGNAATKEREKDMGEELWDQLMRERSEEQAKQQAEERSEEQEAEDQRVQEAEDQRVQEAEDQRVQEAALVSQQNSQQAQKLLLKNHNGDRIKLQEALGHLLRDFKQEKEKEQEKINKYKNNKLFLY